MERKKEEYVSKRLFVGMEKPEMTRPFFLKAFFSCSMTTVQLLLLNVPKDMFMVVLGSVVVTLDPMEKPPVVGTIRGILV